MRAFRRTYFAAAFVFANACGSSTDTASIATKLSIDVQPNGAQSGLVLQTQPVVHLLDAGGKLANVSDVDVSVRIDGGTGALKGTATARSVHGVATFSNLRIDGADDHRLLFEATGLASARSVAFAVTQIPASLTIARQLDSAFVDREFRVQPRVEMRDNAGLLIAISNRIITATRESGDGALSGAVTATTVNGVATFLTLKLSLGGVHSLRFTLTGGPSIVSPQFSVLPPPPLLAASMVSLYTHCALTPSGEAYCWGDNRGLQIGDTLLTKFDRPTRPHRVHTNLRFRSIGVGESHTCAVDLQKKLWCWGLSDFGQMGFLSANPTNVPTPLPSDELYEEVVVGLRHTCARTVSGTVQCWGQNSDGQLGQGDLFPRTGVVTVPGLQAVRHLSGQEGITCATQVDGKVYCWGGFPLVDPSPPGLKNFPLLYSSTVPMQWWVNGGLGGGAAGCGLSTTNSWYCLARVTPGQPDRWTLERAPQLDNFTKVFGSAGTFCALIASGEASCLVGNAYQPVPGALRFSSLALTGDAACGITLAAGRVYCWFSENGQISTPVEVEPP